MKTCEPINTVKEIQTRNLWSSNPESVELGPCTVVKRRWKSLKCEGKYIFLIKISEFCIILSQR